MYRDFIKLSTKEGDMVDITSEVERIIEKSGIENGHCLVFNLGSTGSILVNENEPRLLDDFRELFEKITEGKHRHPSNAHSHLKAGILGPGETIAFKNNQLQLGTWQSIMFCEFDVKPRNRRILVSVIGDEK